MTEAAVEVSEPTPGGLLRSEIIEPPAALERPLADRPEIASVGKAIARMFVVGCGPELATAREVAPKLTETCRVAAEPISTTALAHGPIAAVDSLFPVWAIASRDASLPSVTEAVRQAKAVGATVISCGSAASELEAAYSLSVPEAPAPLLAPLLSVVPGQLFAGALARAKGLDPDSPTGFSKVTLAP